MASRTRDLRRQSGPAFPPAWYERHTGIEITLDDPLAGVLTHVEWGSANQSIELGLYWRGKRLMGTLQLDDVRLLPRVYALLRANISVHIDEIAAMEIPDAP